MRHALRISYRGSDLAGWQRQDNAPTVQEHVEQALARLTETSSSVVGSGRTDAGVHARAQIAHVDLSSPLPCKALVLGTNTFLPESIRVLAAARMAADFHARFSVTGKRYVYRWSTQRVVSPLDALFCAPLDARADLELMTETARQFVGRHDFAAFANAGGAHTTSVRTVSRCEVVASCSGSGSFVELVVEGEGFLKGMVRSMAGTLVEVAMGRLTATQLVELLEEGERSQAGPTAPARGLCLDRVFYPPEIVGTDVYPEGSSWC